jgi:pyruvate formate lyase activating enzyme
VCPNDCLTVAGERYTPDALAAKLNKYKRIFDACGGGVTFSGGEPLIQWEFISEVIDRLDGINVAIETSGYAPKQVFESAVEKLDFIYMDLKLFDAEAHKRHTGCDNTLIKENFLYLRSSGKPFTIRTPLISEITDTEENLSAIKEFIGDAHWEKLPENKLAGAKYDMLIS